MPKFIDIESGLAAIDLDKVTKIACSPCPDGKWKVTMEMINKDKHTFETYDTKDQAVGIIDKIKTRIGHIELFDQSRIEYVYEEE